MTKDSRVVQEITAIVDSMGFWDDQEKVYKINSDTTECLKELLRLLRKDATHFPVLTHLGHINVVEKDLIPIIKGYCLTDDTLADYCIRLLVVLTYPALVFFKEKVPSDVDQKRIFLQINSFLRVYKVTFSQHKDVWLILYKKAQNILEKDPIDQSEEEKILLERILILIRNILHVPKDTSLDIADEDEMITEDLIVSLNTSGVLNLIFQFASDEISHQFCFHLLEIIYSLLRGQCPEFLALDAFRSLHQSKKTKTCAATESLELEEMKERERKMKNFHKSLRFNRFKDPTYVVKNVKSIGEKDLIYHRTTEDPRKISLDHDKIASKRPKNQAPMKDNFATRPSRMGSVLRRPSLKVHKILKEFCERFLKDGYNSLMAYVKSALENKNAQENDETYYFFAAHFFMKFNRSADNDPSLIEETFNFEYFHYLHTKVESYLEHIVNARSDRESIQAYSRRCHTTLKAYKELLFTIASMKNVQDKRFLCLAKEISDKVFYEPDYRELLLNLLCGYDEKKMSPQFLLDLIETNHLFLKLLEHFVKEEFCLIDFILKYSNSKVIKSYLLALKRFETNPATLNHAITRMFHRIACDCKSPVFFFQLSIFRIFQRCFELSKFDRNNNLTELVSFARYIIREFVKLAKDNDKLLIEVLFWKTKREMREIDENYAMTESKEPRKRKRTKGKKNKGAMVADSDRSDRSEQSADERDNYDQIEDLSNNSGEGFIPPLSSTQKVQEPPEQPPSINDQLDDYNLSVLAGDHELPCEAELGTFAAVTDDDDHLIDIDEVLGHVTSNETHEQNGLEQTLLENSKISNDEESDDERFSVIKKKNRIVLAESDDE